MAVVEAAVGDEKAADRRARRTRAGGFDRNVVVAGIEGTAVDPDVVRRPVRIPSRVETIGVGGIANGPVAEVSECAFGRGAEPHVGNDKMVAAAGHQMHGRRVLNRNALNQHLGAVGEIEHPRPKVSRAAVLS